MALREKNQLSISTEISFKIINLISSRKGASAVQQNIKGLIITILFRTKIINPLKLCPTTEAPFIYFESMAEKNLAIIFIVY